jgi:L-amino acid N-acyltransferase YncA
VRPWFAGGFPLVVVEEEGAVIAWASAPPYSRGQDVYREVGFHRRHGKLDGAWRDVVVVARLLGEAAEEHQLS